MRSRICINGSCSSQYLGVFPMPLANVYGMCNNYSAASFMESESNDCTQIVDLETECDTTLNPLFWTEYLNIYYGRTLSSEYKPVTVTNIYKLVNNADHPDVYEYTLVSGAVGPSVLDVSTSTRKCTNFLKEIVYTVEVEEKPAEADISRTAYLNIKSISADIVIEDTAISSPLDSVTGKAMTSVHQKFSIKFVKKLDDTQPI